MGVIFGPSLWQNQVYETEYVQSVSLGDEVRDGGYLICRNGGTAWIVAPSSSEVSRTWDNRNDAVTTATACTNDTGWFVPTLTQLQNPGYTCIVHWDSYSSAAYWSSTAGNSIESYYIVLTNGYTSYQRNTNTYCVRAFRCIAY